MDRRAGNQLCTEAGMGCNMILWDVGKPKCFFVTDMCLVDWNGTLGDNFGSLDFKVKVAQQNSGYSLK